MAGRDLALLLAGMSKQAAAINEISTRLYASGEGRARDGTHITLCSCQICEKAKVFS
jgi:hypothetical protein